MKRGRKQDRKRAILAYVLKEFGNLIFEDIGELLCVTRQRAHQLWIKGRPIFGALAVEGRREWMESAMALQKRDEPIILEHGERGGQGPYKRQWEWDPDRIGKPRKY